MRNILLPIVLSLFFSSSGFSTTPDFDWLLGIDNPSQGQLDSIEALFNKSLKTNLDTSLLVAKHAVKITRESQNQILYARSLVFNGRALIALGNYDAAEPILLHATELAENLNQHTIAGSAYNHLGRLRNNLGEPEDALDFYLKALMNHQSASDTIGMYNSNFNIAGLYYNLKIWDKTEEYTEKAAKLAKNLAPVYKQRILAAKSAIYNSIGISFQNRVDTTSGDKTLLRDSMFYFLQKGIEIDKENVQYYKEIVDKRKEASALNNLVNGYTSLSEYDSALNYGKEAEQLCESVGDDHLLSQSKFNLSNIYLLTGKYQKALEYGKLSLEIAQRQNDKRAEGKANNILRSVYSKLGLYQKALTHYEAYNEYLKDLNDSENKKILADAEAIYQTAESQKHILQQEKDILQLQTQSLKFEKQRNIFFGGGITMLLLSFLGFKLYKTIKDRNEKQEFTKALMFVQEEERKRIARDLHDGIGQSLLLIKKQMSETSNVSKTNQELISETLDEVRAISQDLHPFKLEKFGFTSTVEDSLQKVKNSTSLFITYELDNVDDFLSEFSEINVYRVIQEAMNNIIKHAAATAVKVTIKEEDKIIKILIQDNGKGFDFESAISTSKSLGLKTMQERISSLGGVFSLKKGNPKGTTIELEVPKR